MNVNRKVLGNGVRLITISLPDSPSVTTSIWVGTGSRHEDQKVNGISHFLEHMVFKGSVKRPTAHAISEAVDSFGGEFNAGTSKEWTNFYIKSAALKLKDAFDVLADMVINPLLLPEEIEREKGVIAEEIAMYEDIPMKRIVDYFENLIYQGTPLAMDIVGTPESVKGTTKEDFVKYRAARYIPSKMIVVVAGKVDENEVNKLVEPYFGGLAAGEMKEELPVTKTTSSERLLTKIKKTDQAHLILGFPGFAYGNPNRYTEAVLTTILGGGMSSRLFIEVRERRGLAYAINCSGDHGVDAGHISSYAGVPLAKFDEALKVIKEEYFKLTDIGTAKISDRELTKAKEFLKGHFALSMEDGVEIASFVAHDELYHKPIRTLEEIYKAVDVVTADEVISLASQVFKEDELYLAKITP